MVELPLEVDLLHRLAVGQEAQTQAITKLIEAVMALPAPVVELPGSAAGQLDTAALGAIMRDAVFVGVGPLIASSDQMAAALKALAERPQTPQPTIVRGGSLSKVSLIDFNGNQIGTSGSPIAVTQAAATPLTYLFDYDASGRTIYAGNAVPGSAPSSAVWTIQAFAYTGTRTSPDSIRYGSGIAWSNRTSGVYT